MAKNHKSGFVSLVGAGPGDPGLITLRGAQRLRDADLVIYDRLANPVLLQLAPQAEWISVGKRPNHHTYPQDEINALLVENAKKGKRVVRLKGGDPFVYGRGGEEALALSAARIRFEIVPGISSAIAVPAYAGIPLTHRGIADSAALITGHRANWVEDPEQDWQCGSLGADTLVFLMGVKNLPRIVEQLLHAGRPAKTPVAAIHRGTTTRQTTITGTLGTIVEKAADIRPPAVIVIGEVVSLRQNLRWYDLLENYPLLGLRVLNTKSRSVSGQGSPYTGDVFGDEFSQLIYSLGGEAIHLPAVEIIPPQDTALLRTSIQNLAQSQSYDWVLFTSSNGVSAFFETLRAQGADARSLGRTKFGVIGPATAQALNQYGLIPDFTPTRYTGADLGEQVPIHGGDKVLLPRSAYALPQLPAILQERGASVDEVTAYTIRTAPADAHILDQLIGQKIDLVCFFSPTGVRKLQDMLDDTGYTEELSKILAALKVACIGPTTAEAARDMSIRVDLVAEEFTSAGLVRELVRWRKHS
jgi:uroporphyrinogen III methyltransferase/synthase